MTAWFAGTAGWLSEAARRRRLLVAGLLAVHTGLVGWIGLRQNPTPDEPAHLAAGLSHWEFGNFWLYRVNPPLVRIVAAVPVLAAGAETDWSSWQEGIGVRPEWAVGEDFLAANGGRSFFLFTLARWALIPFSLLGGYIAYRWSGDLFGPRAAVAALVLWCFSPNILAYAALITPDAAAASMGLAAGYFFWRWLRAPGWEAALPAGAILGLAQLTKSTWIVLFALWPALWCLWIVTGREKGLPAGRQAAQLASIVVLALYVLSLGYGFEGFGKRLGDFRFVSAALGGEEVARGKGWVGNRFEETWLAPVPVPLPANYLSGIDLQRKDFEHGMPSYLRGQWREQGWWYYYIYALGVKVPLGTLGLMLVAAGRRLFGRGRRGRWREEVVLLAPAVAVLLLVSSQTGFSRYVRYVVPALPFVLVWLSSAAELIRHRRPAPLAIGGLLAWSVASSLWVYPHSMSYFNEFAGGPRGGHGHLVDANIDWGQDLLYLKRWLDEHPEARPIYLAYYGTVDPRLGGIKFRLPPRAGGEQGREAPRKMDERLPMVGWYAISVNFLRGYPDLVHDGTGKRKWLAEPPFGDFLDFQPVATAGYSIYIYHLSVKEAERLRHEMGLPPLAADDRASKAPELKGAR